MRWLAAPLVGLLILSGSGFLDALEGTTRGAIELARSGEQAPQRARAAAQEVAPLPEIAGLTSQQAVAFESLADALASSAERVENLNESLDEQVAGLEDLARDIDGLLDPVVCIRERVETLTDTSQEVPPSLREITATLGRIIAAQDKSIRHLRSINRKLIAFGVIAGATGVSAPPPPAGAPAPERDAEVHPVDC